VNVRGIILAGSADLKTQLRTSGLLDPRIDESIVRVVDVCYGGESGFYEALTLSRDVLSDAQYMQQRETLQRFFEHVATSEGRCAFGAQEVLQALEMNAVSELIAWDELPLRLADVLPEGKTHVLRLFYLGCCCSPSSCILGILKMDSDFVGFCSC